MRSPFAESYIERTSTLSGDHPQRHIQRSGYVDNGAFRLAFLQQEEHK